MAVRLQMKLGVVPAPDRLPDSPDTVVVVEPTVGSVARSKGSLYLLATGFAPGNRVRDAARLAAETIRDDYYYDESAGIRVCLEKAIILANKKLGHHRDRLGVRDGQENGPIGLAVAVVRGNELYVATVGPAEAYLIRGARLSTLPDPHRERGLPTGQLEPEVWRGEMAVGDSLVLISPNVVAKVGADELKDAMVTLHPQSAMEHLHHGFVTADGAGSDGAIALEAAEVSATQRGRTLVPVRPAEPLAGLPDHSPIPLGDSLTGGVAAVQAGAHQARVAAGGFFGRFVASLQDRLPQRNAAGGRVTTLSARRETQRRAAVALLAFVVLAGALGFAVYLAAGSGARETVSSLAAGQRAMQAAQHDLDQVFGPGVDLVADDPGRAKPLLIDAFQQLQQAQAAQVGSAAINPMLIKVVGGLDRLWHMVDVGSTPIFAFPAKPAVDVSAFVIGPDGAPFVIDKASKTVFRLDVRGKKASPILKAGTKRDGKTVAEPKFLSVAGTDLLILDAKNTLWRWRAANSAGRGTLTTVRLQDATSLGSDVRAIGTFCRPVTSPTDCTLYNFYVVEPTSQQILAYFPSADGSGYPRQPSGWLRTPREVTGVTAVFIDGDLYLADRGGIARFTTGNPGTWVPAALEDTLLRQTPSYRLIASSSDKRTGRLYAYDGVNGRIVALDKTDGKIVAQYRLANGDPGWADLRGIAVIPGQNGDPDRIVWAAKDRIMSSVLEAVPSEPVLPGASVAPSPSPSPSPSVKPSAKASPKATPKPSRR